MVRLYVTAPPPPQLTVPTIRTIAIKTMPTLAMSGCFLELRIVFIFHLLCNTSASSRFQPIVHHLLAVKPSITKHRPDSRGPSQ